MIPPDPGRTAPRAPVIPGWLAAVALAVSALVSCSPHRAFLPKLPPETTVFVQGDVDMVSYKVHLYWFGSDPDGYVVAFELRFVNPDLPADTAWVRTVHTDSLFSVYTPTGTSNPVFEIRAIDDDGMADPTPARQPFKFGNEPPTLIITDGPGARDSTFLSVTASWSAFDPDGDIAKAKYRVWLDGNEANPNVTTATTITIPTEQFRQGPAIARYRKLFVQVVDEGGYAAPPKSLTWYVWPPVPDTLARARLLIVDDEPGNAGAQARQDSLFTNTARRNLPNGTWRVVRLEFTKPFRSAADVEQTFKLYDAVIWYRGGVGTLQPLLTDNRDGLARYLESGGQFFIETQLLASGQGGVGIFPEDWVSRYFGSNFLYKGPDSTVSLQIVNVNAQNQPVVLHTPVFSDSLRQTFGSYAGLRGFAVRDPQFVAVVARPGNLYPANSFDVPVGVTVPQPGAGRLVAITFPLRSLDGFGTVPRLLAKIYAQLGLTGP